ncbi:fimbrial protein [Klebsiella pneumoniae]|uniref:fimbrial protein n=1 Tax=Klebsiella pneumoniae TaxID=573 RepID=UPI002000B047|nr:fimbrial protein [Klebsiella pneumoniae]
MTTPIALRDWRLLAAGCGGLLLLAAAITLHSHWGDFLQWCLATQITLHRYLVMYLLLLNNHQYSGGIWLLVGAFLYGVLHAVGPGHGKFIPGIGMRFSRGGATVNIVYPDVFSSRVYNTTNYSLEGSRFTLEIIKTAATTGSGTLAAGKYTSYDWESGGNPILETYLSANAITVVSPSCSVLSGKNMNVDVGSIRRTDLKGVGTTAGGKDFNIDLQCSGGLSETGYANISTSFSGTLATSTTATMGALLNEKAGSGMAKGIGIQVLKDGSPLQFNKKYTVGRLNNQETRYITIPLHARFYQYGPTTSTGEVESHMIFNLTYD